MDVNGGVVPNAEVVVTSDETGVKQKTTTNLQGNWIAQFLIPGRYGFTVTAAGWEMSGQFNIQSALPVVFNTDLVFQWQRFRSCAQQAESQRIV